MLFFEALLAQAQALADRCQGLPVNGASNGYVSSLVSDFAMRPLELTDAFIDTTWSTWYILHVVHTYT